MRIKLRKLWKRRAAHITKARLADKWATVKLVSIGRFGTGSYYWIDGARYPPLKTTQITHEGRLLGNVEIVALAEPRTRQDNCNTTRQRARKLAARTR